MAGKYETLLHTAEGYISCENDAAELSAASDYLSEQARIYAVTMNPSNVNAYFNEIKINKRRDNAVQDMQNYHPDDEIYTSILSALRLSNELMETEIYSMKLITVANGYDLSEFPEEIQNAQLTPEDAALSPEEMIDKARDLVFNSSYLYKKDDIQAHINLVTRPILLETQQEYTSNSQVIQESINHVRIVLCVLLFTTIFFTAAILLLVIRPLKKYNKCIQEERPLEISGSYEFQKLARTYNEVYQKNAANEILLRERAERDGLTGIMNRGTFDQVTIVLGHSEKPLALLLIDVDEFKQVNDSFGHEVGDQILKKVANLLTDTFRESDIAARIGGDEFAVIMVNATSDIQSVLQKKLKEMNDFLSHPEDGLPPTSLSIGVAFSASGYHKSLYNEADQALYQVKKNGRCGWYFYKTDISS
jgi:diguanylate cyclase (GGDEF)-like protein